MIFGELLGILAVSVLLVCCAELDEIPAGGRSTRYLAGWYLALTAGAFFSAATH